MGIGDDPLRDGQALYAQEARPTSSLSVRIDLLYTSPFNTFRTASG